MANKHNRTNKAGSARQRKAAAYADRVRRQRRKNYTFIAVIVAVVALVLVLVIWSNRDIELVTTRDFSHYDGIPVDTTEDGLPRLGSPNAPVVLEEYSSFTCGHCAHFHDTLIQLIDEYVRDGTLAVVFEPSAGNALSRLGAEAMLFAVRHDPVNAWDMHYLLFSWHGTAIFPYTQGNVSEAAGEIGLNRAEFNACLDEHTTFSVLQAVGEQAQEREINGTPALFFNGARPECGGDDKCEGNLPYNIIVDNIERLLTQADQDTEAEDN